MSTKHALCPQEFNTHALLGIFRVLKQYLSDGGTLTNAVRLCRETLFFIYEGGNRNKYDRHPVSAAASRLRGARGKRYDHAIPLAYWLEDVLLGDLSDPKAFQEAIRRWYHIRIITEEEHRKLGDVGLGDRMPMDWDQTDVEARYKKAGIIFV